MFFTQITMEAAEDTSFLDAMKAARIKRVRSSALRPSLLPG